MSGIRNSDLLRTWLAKQPRPHVEPIDDTDDEVVRREAAILVLLTCARLEGRARQLAERGASAERIEAYRQAIADVRAQAGEWAR